MKNKYIILVAEGMLGDSNKILDNKTLQSYIKTKQDAYDIVLAVFKQVENGNIEHPHEYIEFISPVTKKVVVKYIAKNQKAAGEKNPAIEELPHLSVLPYPFSQSASNNDALFIRSALKAYLNRNDTPSEEPPRVYLLLAGDIDVIPSFTIPVQLTFPYEGNKNLRHLLQLLNALGTLTDYYYADLSSNFMSGEFSLPQVIVSRLPVSSSAELEKILQQMAESLIPVNQNILAVASNQKMFDCGSIYKSNRYTDNAKNILSRVLKAEPAESGLKEYKHDWVEQKYRKPYWDLYACYNRSDKLPGQEKKQTDKITGLVEIINKRTYKLVYYLGDSDSDRWSVSLNSNFWGFCNHKDFGKLNDVYSNGEHKGQRIPLVAGLTCGNCWQDRWKEYSAVNESLKIELKRLYGELTGRGEDVRDENKFSNLLDKLLQKIYDPDGNYGYEFDHQTFGASWLMENKACTFLGATRVPVMEYNRSFYEILSEILLKDSGDLTVGELVVRTYKAFYAAYAQKMSGNRLNMAIDHLRMYMLLGDPTILI